jgi:hypothetical protein
LKIDVEGHEREVLEGADWKLYRPRVVVVEAIKPNKPIPTHEHWESLLLSADYLFAFFDGLNRYYVRAEDRELMPLLSLPANVFDDFESFSHRHRVRELEHQVQELRQSADEIRTSSECSRVALGETRAALGETRAALGETRAALGETRTALEEARQELAAARLERNATRAALRDTGAALDELRGRHEGTQAELDAARARLDLFDGWGPLTISVVRRLRRISARFPLATSLAKRAISTRRRLLGRSGPAPRHHGPHLDEARLTPADNLRPGRME